MTSRELLKAFDAAVQTAHTNRNRNGLKNFRPGDTSNVFLLAAQIADAFEAALEATGITGRELDAARAQIENENGVSK